MARTAARRPARDDARPEVRGFIGRDGEALSRNRETSGTHVGPLHVPDRLRESGWAMQWCRAACIGKPDASNISNYQDNGWRPVPADRPGFSEHFRIDNAGCVEYEGLVLMERPEAMNVQAREDDYREAMQQRNGLVEEFALSDLPAGFERGYGRAAKKVTRSLEVAPSDSYPVHELGDDE